MKKLQASTAKLSQLTPREQKLVLLGAYLRWETLGLLAVILVGIYIIGGLLPQNLANVLTALLGRASVGSDIVTYVPRGATFLLIVLVGGPIGAGAINHFAVPRIERGIQERIKLKQESVG
jgi:hypothetical protein